MVDKEREMVMDEERLDAVEHHARALEARLTEVEALVARGAAAPAREEDPFVLPVTEPLPSEWLEAETELLRNDDGDKSAGAAGPSFEDLLGGRVLAWLGGVAVLVGVAFFLAIAISHGWLGEAARCVLAAGGAVALLGFGVRTRERGGSREAALAASGAAIAALDATVAVAAQSYNLIGVEVAVGLALVVGAVATVLAIRWRAQGVAALGIVGGLLAPALAGAPYDATTIVVLLAISVPAAAVCVAQQWERIALGAFLVTVPQVGLWLLDGDPPAGGAMAALAAFGAIAVAQAVGFELRTKAPELRAMSAFLLTLDALALAAAGAAVLLSHGDGGLAHAWLAGLAVAHLAIGLGAERLERVSRELGLLALSLGVVLADVALAATLSGVALPVGYAVGALAFAGLARALPATQADHLFVRAGLGGHVLLAAAHALAVDAPTTALTGGSGADVLDAAIALGAVAAASFAGARVATLPRGLRGALDATALGAIAWLALLTLDPVPLAVAWAAEGTALALVWRRTRDEVAAAGAWAHLTLAGAVALATVAPPLALVDGLDDPLGAALALGALALALARCATIGLTLTGRTEEDGVARATLLSAAALVALALASMLVVTPLAPHPGQVALSALWGVTGVATLVAGLVADRPALRRGALVLLLVTVGKVFLVDLATLDSAARAGSFLALGVLLLGAAFAWQRVRPGEVPVGP
jgi:uncharacterized membrane protein